MNQVIYIMGVSGCGKSTIGKMLSDATGYPFFDGDDFHTKVNLEKMRLGHPLDDEDRLGWLMAIHDFAEVQQKQHSIILACSALKEKYREILSASMENFTRWVYLKGDYNFISERLTQRKGHFMPASLLQSQFDALEEPVNALVIEINKTAEEMVMEIRKKISLY